MILHARHATLRCRYRGINPEGIRYHMAVTSRDTKTGLSPGARKSIAGGVISLLIDSYDIYVPAFILPAAMDYFEPSTMATTTKVTLVSVIFTVKLLERPVGGAIFGNHAVK